MAHFNRIACAIVFCLIAPMGWAQVPVDQLAKAPADAQRFTIMSTAGKHGQSARWTAADGNLRRSTAGGFAGAPKFAD